MHVAVTGTATAAPAKRVDAGSSPARNSIPRDRIGIRMFESNARCQSIGPRFNRKSSRSREFVQEGMARQTQKVIQIVCGKDGAKSKERPQRKQAAHIFAPRHLPRNGVSAFCLPGLQRIETTRDSDLRTPQKYPENWNAEVPKRETQKIAGLE